MDVEKLIHLIHERTCLWDIREKRYHMRDMQRKYWNEVSEELKVNVEDAKRKWRGLRDTFRREYQKSFNHKSGNKKQSVPHSKWLYFKYLLFLSHAIEKRKLTGNLSSQKQPIEQDSEYDDSESCNGTLTPETGNNDILEIELETDLQQPASTELSKTPSNNHHYNKHRKLEEPAYDKFLEVERAKFKTISEVEKLEENYDYQFLLSLLPFLKKIPDNRKMIVRNKLQQVFIDEEQLMKE